MSVLTCAEVRELAPELALGILGRRRARRGASCTSTGAPRCQAYVAELTEAADVLPQLVPEVEPPAGFEARALRRFGDDARRSRRRWIASIAAVAAAVAIVSITVVRVVEAGDDDHDRGAHRRGAVAVAMAMAATASQSIPAGWAYVTDQHGVAVSVNYGVPPGNYRVQVTPAEGAATSIGTMRIEDNHGSWTGRSKQALAAGARIALVDDTGAEVCHGTVPRAE